jgi:hypothetical protein
MQTPDAGIRRITRLLLDARPAQYCESCIALKIGVTTERSHELLAAALRIVKLVVVRRAKCSSCGRTKTIFGLTK